MIFPKKFFLFFIVFLISFQVHANRETDYLLYLSKIQEPTIAIRKYLESNPANHDSQFLQKLSHQIIKNGASSSDPESQLLALFATSFSNSSLKLYVCRRILERPPSPAHIAAIRALGELADDSAEKLLVEQCNSTFIPIRFEAIYQLSLKKSRFALGQIESLEALLPAQFHVHLPELVALIGSPKADAKLKKYLSHENPQVRLAAIHAALNNTRSSCLEEIKSMLTHSNIFEREVAAYALGALRDTSSTELLQKLATSNQSEVKLAAQIALVSLGYQEPMQQIAKAAKKRNLYAIPLLVESAKSDVLYSLLHDPDTTTSLNATLTLLKKRDPKCLHNLQRILQINPTTHFLSLKYSSGGVFCYFKVEQKNPKTPAEIKKMQYFQTIFMQEKILEECLHLSESAFLHVSQAIIQNKIYTLIPMTTRLLQSLGTEAAIRVLKQFSQTPGEPLIRNHCCLALLQLGESKPYEKQLLEWLKHQPNLELIQLKPMQPWINDKSNSKHELSATQSSELLLQTMQMFSLKKEHKAISLILELMKKAQYKNQVAFAGILLQAIQ